uniref:Proline rich transmembrane protein 1 n=1 Tax=Latimeria chalumnae TaxID=7897 RepID=H2ZTW3_LATCH
MFFFSFTGLKDGGPQTSPPPYNPVQDAPCNGVPQGYPAAPPPPPMMMGTEGFMEETQFNGTSQGYTIQTHPPPGSILAGGFVHPGYPVQFQPCTAYVPVYPVGTVSTQIFLHPQLYPAGNRGALPGLTPPQMQPGVPVMEAWRPPHDYLPIAVLTTICCFWPTGIIAIIKAVQVR